MLSKSVKRVVEVLSMEYGFELESAYELLEDVEKKEMVLPFVRKVSGWCDGLKSIKGLYVQCNNKPIKGGMLCKTCEKHGGKHGLASEREAEGEEWRDRKGKKAVHYGNVMSKLNVKKEDVKKAMMRIYNMKESDIPEELFMMNKPQRGRPKKVKTEMSCAEKKEEVSHNKEDTAPTKKRRGRPKKENKEVITEAITGCDLIETLISQANKSSEVVTTTKTENRIEKETDEKPDADEEMEVELITIDGVEYMVDDDKIVYNVETHEPIGKFDGENIEFCEFEYED